LSREKREDGKRGESDRAEMEGRIEGEEHRMGE